MPYFIDGFDPDEPKFPQPYNPAKDPAAVPVFDAKEMIADYERDKDAAEKKYSGRAWVKGTVTEISGPTVTLEGPNGVHCVYVSVGDQARMSLGQVITIEGTLNARRMPGMFHLFRAWKARP